MTWHFLGSHIRPNFHDRSCLDDPLAKLKREIELAMEEIKQREREHIRVPSKWKTKIKQKQKQKQFKYSRMRKIVDFFPHKKPRPLNFFSM